MVNEISNLEKQIKKEKDEEANKIVADIENKDWKSFVDDLQMRAEEGSAWNYSVLERIIYILLEKGILLERGKLGEEIFAVEIITLMGPSLNALSHFTCFPNLGFKNKDDAENYFNEQFSARKKLGRNIDLIIIKETIIKKSKSDS